MIDTPDQIYRTTEEWKVFLRLNFHLAYDLDNIPTYWYTDKFWNWILGKFNYGKNGSDLSYEQTKLVYQGKAYLWRNPIFNKWEVVQPPESKMLDFMDLQ